MEQNVNVNVTNIDDSIAVSELLKISQNKWTMIPLPILPNLHKQFYTWISSYWRLNLQYIRKMHRVFAQVSYTPENHASSKVQV